MKPFFVLFTGLFILHASAGAQAISMTVESITQGKFKGESLNPRGGDRGDRMDVYGVSMEVVIGTDAATGQASRRRQHQPFFIRKVSGAASPQFFQAAVSNDVLKRVVIEFRGTNPN